MSEQRSPSLAFGLIIAGSLASSFITGYLGVSIAAAKLEVQQQNTMERVSAMEILAKQQADKDFQQWQAIYELRERLGKHEAQTLSNPRSVP